MHKWIGIRASGVLAILGSLVTLLFAGSMVFTVLRPLTNPPESPLPLKAILWVMAGVFAAFSGWGMASAIGIFRHRGWARLSMIVFACLLVGMGGSALVGILFIHLPETPSVSPETMRNVRLGIAAFYGALTLIGTWWLLLFNSGATKQYFATAPPAPGERPLSISIIAWYLLLCALGTAVGAILRMPGMLFGTIFTGWVAVAVYTAYTAIQIYLGTGLLQLQEPARLGSIGYFAFLLVNSVMTCALPGFAVRMQTLMEHMPRFMRTSQSPVDVTGSGGFILGGVLVVVLPIWFLVRRRAAFRS